MDDIKIILASKSPRRQQLIKELGYDVEIRIKEVEEIYPDELSSEDVPVFLAELKAEPFLTSLKTNELLVTSDTVVVLDGQILGKPKDRSDAIQMLKRLSNKTHNVVSGVQLMLNAKAYSFSAITSVHFDELTEQEIEFYIDNYEPFDKAGSYGIQEWIGHIGISKIEGCYYNVMGLPINAIRQALADQYNLALKLS